MVHKKGLVYGQMFCWKRMFAMERIDTTQLKFQKVEHARGSQKGTLADYHVLVIVGDIAQ